MASRVAAAGPDQRERDAGQGERAEHRPGARRTTRWPPRPGSPARAAGSPATTSAATGHVDEEGPAPARALRSASRRGTARRPRRRRRARTTRRSRGPGRRGSNEAWIRASEPGVSSAPPTPCRTRAAIEDADGRARPRTAATPARTRPPRSRNTRRRPYRSPSAPPSRISPASDSVYPVTIHCRPERGASRSSPMRGSAMLTTVASSKARLEPSTVAASAHRPAALDSRRAMASP